MSAKFHIRGDGRANQREGLDEGVATSGGEDSGFCLCYKVPGNHVPMFRFNQKIALPGKLPFLSKNNNQEDVFVTR